MTSEVVAANLLGHSGQVRITLESTGNANLMMYLIIADPNFPIVPRGLMLARGGVG
jgi:hypothetical protein